MRRRLYASSSSLYPCTDDNHRSSRVAAAVLHLGQLEFRRLRGSIGEGDKYSESCRIADDGPLLLAAGLLGVDAEAMQKCIVCRSMNIKGIRFDHLHR